MKRKEAILALTLTGVLLLAAAGQRKPEHEPEPVKPQNEVWYVTVEPEPLEHWTDHMPDPLPVAAAEPEKIYFDTDLSHELQDFIADVCEGYHISPALIIAMIERESSCVEDAVGDNGDSFGLMQIQEKWHEERMERLGVTDLLDPEQNILVGVDFVHELFQRNDDIYWVLMTYNGGQRYADNHLAQGIISEYAHWVAERSAELEQRRDEQCAYSTCCQ